VNKYRKKPVEVEAVQFTGGPDAAFIIVKWILDGGGRAYYETKGMDTVKGMIGIQTLEGRMYTTPGDFIIRGVQGEFYPCKPDIFEQTYEEVHPPLLISGWNRRLIEEAFDDGDGNILDLVANDDAPWFNGEYDGSVVMEGAEHNGTLYSIVHASGGGLVSVIVGKGLVENDAGVVFHSVSEAKAYVQGLIAK